MPVSLVVAILIFAPACSCAEFACPASQDKHPLTNASVFDGLPEEHADLMPDSSTGKGSTVVSTWAVGYLFDAGRKVYLVCQYAGTTKTAVVKVETTVENCTYHASAKDHAPSLVCK